MDDTTNLTALINLLSGVPCDPVVVGADDDDLHERGEAFVEQHGSNADYALCSVEVLPTALRYRPRLRRVTGGHRDFQVVVGDAVLVLIEVFPRQAHPANYRRTPRNRAVEFVLNGPNAALFYRHTSLKEAAGYVERLGIGPAPLWELARDRGWDVPGEVA